MLFLFFAVLLWLLPIALVLAALLAVIAVSAIVLAIFGVAALAEAVSRRLWPTPLKELYS